MSSYPRASTTQLGPAGATPMTALSAAGCATSVGWCTSMPCPACWPSPDSGALAALDGVIRRMPDGAVVLLDGLIASAAPEVLVSEARRLRLVVLVHMPLGDRAVGVPADTIRTRERAVLSAAAAVVTTSEWSRNRLLALYQLPAERLHVAEPGVDAADARNGFRGRRGHALRRVGDPRQGSWRPARRAADAVRSHLAVRLRRSP